MKKVIIVTIGFLCLLMVGEVQAQCTFNDVPESHIFYDYITDMCELGITTGYPDGTYRPGNNVTRGQMSAFTIRAIESLQLACVTASMERGPIGNGDYIVEITSTKNISVSDWSEVFTASVVIEPDDIEWGLFCNDDWVNTGCSQKHSGDGELCAGLNEDLDIRQTNNGCSSDNEEYCWYTIYTTCCKIVKVNR